MPRFRTPELERILLLQIRQHQTEGIASTEDIMPAAAQYVRTETGETNEKATVSASNAPVSPKAGAAAASGGHCAANGDIW
jgi:hypothetical protein